MKKNQKKTIKEGDWFLLRSDLVVRLYYWDNQIIGGMLWYYSLVPVYRTGILDGKGYAWVDGGIKQVSIGEMQKYEEYLKNHRKLTKKEIERISPFPDEAILFKNF